MYIYKYIFRQFLSGDYMIHVKLYITDFKGS